MVDDALAKLHGKFEKKRDDLQRKHANEIEQLEVINFF